MHIKTATQPSFQELEAFIKANPASTICEIRDHFNQQGEFTFATNPDSPVNIDGTSSVMAYDINEPFWRHLQQFMKQDHVRVQTNTLACLVSDSTLYVGDKPFLPLVLSIQ